MISKGRYRFNDKLDKFHLRGAINRASDNELATEVCLARTAGEADKATRLLIDFRQKACGDKAKEIAQLR